MMIHSLFLLLVVLSFLSLLTSTFGSSADDASSAANCSSSSTCGGVEISYPFWRSDGPPSFSAVHCGYPGFGIACEEDKQQPILQIGSGHSYKVTNIDYANRTINLTDMDVILATPDTIGCPRSLHNFTFSSDVASSLNYTGADANLTFFFGCPDPAGLQPDFPHNVIPCLGYEGNSTFVFRSDDVPYNFTFWSGTCEDVVVAPVLLDILATYNFSEALNYGFQLAWMAGAAEGCGECESSGGRCGFNQTSASPLCFCPDGTRAGGDCGYQSSKKSWRKEVFIGVGGVLFVCLCLVACLLYYKKSCDLLVCWKKKSKTTPSVESFVQKYGSLNTKWYRYLEVKRMTKSFADKLGQGGFGIVYKGSLPNGHLVAVKILTNSKENGEEFINEVASISRTSHVNIVRLLGFCLDGSKRALIYDFMPNGSLERFIFNDRSQIESALGWNKLFEIVVGVARGLEYLHRGCNTRIVHFDIKPHNILLDRDFCPKISDFGLAKLCTSKESIISLIGARGTIGYIAPEVFSRNFGVVSSKSDVYSYGMMVLEMVGGRKNLNVTTTSSSATYFPHYLYKNINQYCVEACGDNGEATEIVRKMILVALWCIQTMPDDRPSMSRVVNMLEGDISDLQLPPKP
ncbi:LEAF RUST 10 DISEASE-RESISTANCE LOCUS RECEPTOR-LIKE PROTEIN KINASE-like 2.1 isoform X2 [Ananas comosus]|uniref:non-specific serine/threonine protein kinase n=1 Tax=Ananas comosus TaxID=4615 RepID=A0A6P5GH13_ANACO|nr:LEAF RUST 10 DISEASE-RESISTANCE LOCUS RECEPTOR-LIKE PROTEIN KINASE-like 2.1 isoform X2 [Ananas comosus]